MSRADATRLCVLVVEWHEMLLLLGVREGCGVVHLLSGFIVAGRVLLGHPARPFYAPERPVCAWGHACCNAAVKVFFPPLCASRVMRQ